MKHNRPKKVHYTKNNGEEVYYDTDKKNRTRPILGEEVFRGEIDSIK